MTTRPLRRLLLLLVLLVHACGDDAPAPDASPPDADVADAALDASPDATIDAGIDPPPDLGALIDQSGRPGMTFLVNYTFEDDATRDLARRMWNTTDPFDADTLVPTVRATLAVWDGLDSVCGNQPLADLLDTRYHAMATVLAEDRIYIDRDGTSCSYLGIEGETYGFLEAPDTCGGRAPTDEVIDLVYSLLVGPGTDTRSDGVDADDATHSSTDFPFLAAP